MRLETRKCLADIQRAAELVQGFTFGNTLANYEQDILLRSAVERQFRSLARQ